MSVSLSINVKIFVCKGGRDRRGEDEGLFVYLLVLSPGTGHCTKHYSSTFSFNELSKERCISLDLQMRQLKNLHCSGEVEWVHLSVKLQSCLEEDGTIQSTFQKGIAVARGKTLFLNYEIMSFVTPVFSGNCNTTNLEMKNVLPLNHSE
jgi:hypothetical protein